MTQHPKHKDAESPPVRHNKTEAIGRTTAVLGRRLFIRAGFRDSALVLHWADIVGPEVAQLCQPLKLTDGASGKVLTLKVEPGASAFLQHESRGLCERINSGFAAETVTRLRFVQGSIMPILRSPARRDTPADMSPGDPAFSFRGPEPVREALIKLARRRAGNRGPD